MSYTTKTKTRLMSGAGLSVLVSLLAGGVYAAETSVSSDLSGASAAGHKYIFQPVTNSGTIGASVTNEQGGLTVTGDQTGTTNTVTDNIINANATANAFTNSIDLSLIQDDPGTDPNVGIASLGLAINTGAVSSSVTGSALALDLTGFQSGTAINNDNTIQAATTVNAGATSVAGTIPNGYTSQTEGVTNLGFGPTGTAPASQGSVAASSIQSNEGVNHSATVTDNVVSLALQSDLTNTVDTSPTLDRNTIDSTLAVNSATSTVDIQQGGAPTFAGSAVIANGQGNVDSSADATNEGSRISATVEGTTGGAVNRLNGGLSVQDNTISSAVVGNQANGNNGTAGNRILIGDTVSVDGPGTGTGTGTTGRPTDGAPGSFIEYNSGDLASESVADFVIQSSQGNVDGPSAATDLALSSTTVDGTVTALVRSLDDGSITLADNAVTSRAIGNTASSAVMSGADAAAFEATVAVSNQQSNDNVDVAATTSGAAVVAITSGASGAGGGVTNESAVTVTGNRTVATGYGNDATQTVALSANTLNPTAGLANMEGGTTGLTTDGNVAVTGNVTIANLQSNYSSDVTVQNTGSVVGLDADSRETLAGQPRALIAASTLTTDANVQEAVALGSRGANALSLDGNTVGGGAGIANVQIVDNTSTISAELSGSQAGLVAGTHVEDSSLAVTGNLQRAIGYGTTASNDLSVAANGANVAPGTDATEIAYDTTGQPFHSGTSQPTLAASFGVLSDQSLEDTVTASAAGNLIAQAVEGDLTGSSAANDRNAMVAAGYGLDATNRIDLDIGTLDTGGLPAVVGSLANTQAVVGASAAVSATVSGGNPEAPSGNDVIVSFVEDSLSNATVSTSNNQVQALATGAGANNTLAVAGNTIDVANLPSVQSFNQSTTGALSNESVFGLTNAQSGQGSVTASLVDDTANPTTSASVVTVLGPTGGGLAAPVPGISGSTVVSDENTLTAEATSNRATNALSIAANAVQSSSGLLNFQAADADISAHIGVPGQPPSPGGPFSYFFRGDPGDPIAYDSGTNSIDAGTLIIDTSSLTEASIQFLIGEGWTLSGPNELSRNALVDPLPATLAEFQDATDPGPGASRSDTAPGLPGSPAAGGVTIVAEGDTIDGSTLSVAANRVSGAVTGNTASNAVSVDAGTIETTLVQPFSSATTPGVAATTDLAAITDHALVSDQRVEGGTAGTLESDVQGSFGIVTPELTTPADVEISDSTVDVTGNSLRATSVANIGENALDLEGNAIAAGSVLVSRQAGDAAVSAASGMEVFAPAAVESSSVDMSSNTNTALGVLNDATNASTVSGTSVDTLDATAAAAGETGNARLSFNVTDDELGGIADHLVQNLQEAATSVASSAETSLYNVDGAATATSGLVGSSLTASANVTYSEASANRATNSLALNGGSSLSATGGISNLQVSSADATADATASLGLTLAGDSTATPDPTAALAGSTVTVEGNNTEALARGNRAVNTLSAVAGAGYATSTGAQPARGSAGSGGAQSAATYAALNVQDNGGAVTARSANATYQIALNADPVSNPGVTDGRVSLGGNSVVAHALGNSAVNRVTLAGLNTGTPTAGIASSQTNSGGITASVTDGSIAMASTGLAGGSSFSVGGNSVSASATGNSVSNAIARVSR